VSKRLLSIMLSELGTIRLHCKTCGVVVEIAVDGMKPVLVCPCCQRQFFEKNAGGEPLQALCKALETLRAVLKSSTQLYDVEFVIPVAD
jgi:hypothetical protein